MESDESIRTCKHVFKQILHMMIGVILILTFNSCKATQSKQTTVPKQSIEETEPEVLPPGKAKILGIAGNNRCNYGIKWWYEYLEVDIKVNVGEEERYNFFALLYSADGECVTLGDLKGPEVEMACRIESAYLPKGVSTVPIYFHVRNIRKIKMNAPYKVHIYLCSGDSKELDNAEVYTSTYKNRQFSKDDDD